MAFRNAVTPATLEELLHVLAQDDCVRFWRGCSDARWPLDSGVVRRLRAEGTPATETSARHFERRLLMRARHRGFDIVDGVRLADFELLALLRHYGAATRLVDFSRSAGVALWFTVSEHPDVEGELVGVHTDYVGGYEGEPEEGDYEEVLEPTKRVDHVMTWEPRRSTPRVAAQHSQFLYGQVRELYHGSMWMPVDHPDGVMALRIRFFRL